MSVRRPSPRHPAVMAQADHRRLWRMVEGAVLDALACHPDYLTDKGRRSAVLSITKRVVGQLVGHGKGALRRGRLGGCQGEGNANAPVPAGGVLPLPALRGGGDHPPRTRRPALAALLTGEGAA